MSVIFGLAAITTSYITVAAALSGFVHDFRINTLKIARDNKYFDFIVACIPPLFITLIMQNIFLSAQEFVGGFGIALLFGVLPAIILLKDSKGLVKRSLSIALILLFSSIVIMTFLKDINIIHLVS
jgi:tyrosine-specific transport protein